jgi:hypothetical protein
VPDSITLVQLPAYSPELNPVERIWEYLKKRYLSHRLLDDYDAIVDAASYAWNKFTAETAHLGKAVAIVEPAQLAQAVVIDFARHIIQGIP